MKLTKSTHIYEGKRYYTVILNDCTPCMANTTDMSRADDMLAREIGLATRRRQSVDVYSWDGDLAEEKFLFSAKP